MSVEPAPAPSHAHAPIRRTVDAERAINEALAQLERDTGQIVDGLEILDVDISTIADTAPRLLRTVRVRLKPMPGSLWMEGVKCVFSKEDREHCLGSAPGHPPAGESPPQ